MAPIVLMKIKRRCKKKCIGNELKNLLDQTTGTYTVTGAAGCYISYFIPHYILYVRNPHLFAIALQYIAVLEVLKCHVYMYGVVLLVKHSLFSVLLYKAHYILYQECKEAPTCRKGGGGRQMGQLTFHLLS